MSHLKVLYPNMQQIPDPQDPEKLIDDYLDHLCAPLVGIVPFERRLRLREEAKYHILGRVETFSLDGLGPLDATREALAAYGDTQTLSEQFLEEWERSQVQGFVGKRLGLSFSYAAFFWCEATFVAQLIIIYRMMSADASPYTFGLSRVQFRQIWPEPLPLPESGMPWIVLCIYTFFAPFIAGALTGAKVVTNGVNSTVLSLMMLIIIDFVLGSFMLPMKDGLWLAFVQLLWWMPMGILSCYVTSAIARRWRLRFRPLRKVKSYE